jgi:hypothetical protein
MSFTAAVVMRLALVFSCLFKDAFVPVEIRTWRFSKKFSLIIIAAHLIAIDMV